MNVASWLNENTRPAYFLNPRRISRKSAIGLVAVLFLSEFGYGLVQAIRHLTRPSTPQFPSDWSHASRLIVDDVSIPTMVAIASVAVSAYLLRDVPPQVTRPRLRVTSSTTATYIAVLVLAALVARVLSSSGYPYPRITSTSATYAMLTSLTAGPGEEFLFALMIPVTLRACRTPWPWIIAISTMLRWSFHVYYGWSSISVLIWAPMAVILVARTGAIWGVVLAHSAWDLQGTAGHLWPHVGYFATVALLLTTCLVLRWEGRALDQRRAARKEQRA